MSGFFSTFAAKLTPYIIYMANESVIKLFEGKQVRIVWNEEEEKYYFSVADIVQVLTESADTKQYIKRMRTRDPELDSVWGTICTPHQFVSTDGKKHAVNCATLEGIFRIIQSIPSKKAEPVKRWLAEVGAQRIDQMIDPEQTFQMAVEDYRRQGYSDKWINERMRSIEMRKELTDEWQRSGITEHKDFAILTNVLTQAWSGMTTGQYKKYKGLTKENLRDNMTNIELALNTIAEVATTEISRQRNPKGMGKASKPLKPVDRLPGIHAKTWNGNWDEASYPRNVHLIISSRRTKSPRWKSCRSRK